jgi:hypothetical protein
MTDRTRNAAASVDTTDTSTSFSRNGSAWSEVTALSDDQTGAYRIRLGGMLRSTWMLGVCTGLARQNISIDRAHARRLAHDGTWIAELHVIAMPGSADPLQLPLISFAEEVPVDTGSALALREYELLESTDHGGTLRLTFSAQDSVGLLGSLLRTFSGVSLLPVEMHIETRGMQACDCLWLSSLPSDQAGDQPDRPRTPSAEDRRTLDGLLKRMVQH